MSSALRYTAFAFVAISLEKETHLSFAMSYRVACAAISLFLIWKIRSDYPEEHWPKISLWVAFFVNVAIFFTPLVDRPASRGELMLFALPDAIIVLVTCIASYTVVDVHQRHPVEIVVTVADHAAYRPLVAAEREKRT